MPQDTALNVIRDTLNVASSNINQKMFDTSHADQIFGINKDYATLIFIPIFSFFLALLFNWIRGKIKLKSQLNEKQEYLFTWIDLISPQIEKQAALLKQYADNLKQDEPQSLMFKRVDLHLEKLKVISAIELVNLFVTNKNVSHLKSNTLLFKWENYLSLLEKKTFNINEVFDGFKKYRTNSIKEWNDWMAKLHESYITFIQSQITEDAKSNNKTIIQLTKLYKEWTSKKGRSRKETQEVFLDPLELLCISFRSEYPKNEKILPLIMANSTLKRLSIESEKTHADFSKIFIGHSNEFLSFRKGLIEAKTELKEVGFKKLFYLK